MVTRVQLREAWRRKTAKERIAVWRGLGSGFVQGVPFYFLGWHVAIVACVYLGLNEYRGLRDTECDNQPIIELLVGRRWEGYNDVAFFMDCVLSGTFTAVTASLVESSMRAESPIAFVVAAFLVGFGSRILLRTEAWARAEGLVVGSGAAAPQGVAHPSNDVSAALLGPSGQLSTTVRSEQPSRLDITDETRARA